MIVCVKEYIIDRENSEYPEMATWFIDLVKLSSKHPYRIAIEEAIKFREEMGSDIVDYEFDGEINFSDSPASILAADEEFDEDYPDPFVYEFPMTVAAIVRLCVMNDDYEFYGEDQEELSEDDWRLMQMAPASNSLN